MEEKILQYTTPKNIHVQPTGRGNLSEFQINSTVLIDLVLFLGVVRYGTQSQHKHAKNLPSCNDTCFVLYSGDDESVMLKFDPYKRCLIDTPLKFHS